MALEKDRWIDVNYQNYWHILYQYSCNIIRDTEQAADIVQEVFVYIWDNFEALHIEHPKAYLIQAVRNKSLHYLEKMSFDTVQIEQAYFSLVDNDQLTQEQELLLKEQLVEAIYNTAQDILPSKCYEIFILRFYNRLSYKEIAKKLEISESTVDNQISKALKIIKLNLPYSVNYVFILGVLFQLR